jgi:hypothetical protein
MLKNFLQIVLCYAEFISASISQYSWILVQTCCLDSRFRGNGVIIAYAGCLHQVMCEVTLGTAGGAKCHTGKSRYPAQIGLKINFGM